jgi:hypothetical protein
MSRRMAESVAQGMYHMAHQSTLSETNEDLFHDARLEIQEQMQNPFAFHAEMMGDILYLQQVLRQPDAKEFVQAVIKEVNGHVDCKNWTLKKRSKVPEDVQIVPSVWSMQLTRDLTTNKIKSQKTRLNLHGRKQIYGMNYFETYAPVVTWFAIRLMIIFGIISVGLFAKLILLWLIRKLQSRWTSTWSFLRVSRLRTGTPKITC